MPTEPSPLGQPIPPAWRTFVLVAGAYTLAMCVYLPIRAWTGTDFHDFWENARWFLHRGEVRFDLGVHNYLPFFTLFMAPWGILPLEVALNLFTLLSVGLLVCTALMADVILRDDVQPPHDLLHHRDARGAAGARSRAAQPSLTLILPLLLVAPYAHSTLTLGAVNILLLFLITSCWLLVRRGREWIAGVPLGLAVLIKLLPAALLPMLLLARRWRSAAAALGVMIALGAGFTLLVLGPERMAEAHQQFRGSALESHGARQTLSVEKPQKAKYSNVSVPIVMRRLLTPVNADPHEDRPGFLVNITDLPRESLWPIYAVMMASLLFVTLAATWRAGRSEAPEPLNAALGAWIALMLLAAPLVWTHYLVLMHWPLAVAAHRLVETRRREGRICRAAASALIVWIIAIAALASPHARAVGTATLAIAVVWGVMITLALATPRPARAARG
ncbi:MAG: DUF2029 domain-containing protein [Phycisphaerales bacterium]|nr:DUF2029 domain-containing protein [Phycisphaerales bacterium]